MTDEEWAPWAREQEANTSQAAQVTRQTTGLYVGMIGLIVLAALYDDYRRSRRRRR